MAIAIIAFTAYSLNRLPSTLKLPIFCFAGIIPDKVEKGLFLNRFIHMSRATGIDAFLCVFFHGVGRQGDDRHLLPPRLCLSLPYLAGSRVPVSYRHLHIHEYHVVAVRLEHLERLLTVFGNA